MKSCQSATITPTQSLQPVGVNQAGGPFVGPLPYGLGERQGEESP